MTIKEALEKREKEMRFKKVYRITGMGMSIGFILISITMFINLFIIEETTPIITIGMYLMGVATGLQIYFISIRYGITRITNKEKKQKKYLEKELEDKQWHN